MKIITFFSIIVVAMLSSCVSNKKYAELNEQYIKATEEINNRQSSINICQEEKNMALAEISALEASNVALSSQVFELRNTNAALLSNVGDLATLSKKEAENLEKSLESIREKDTQIRSLHEAITKKDSVTLALVTSLKGVLDDLNDEDIEINVEKGVVFISISDKMLFKSGSYKITSKAKVILGKIAKVVNDKPDLDFMVEGHTDTILIYQPGIIDNWDLSVHRATSVVRVLQKEFGVAPERMTAAGRSFYIPIADNDTSENRAKNRRTRLVVLPRLDEFYHMVERGMKQAAAADRVY